MKTSHKVAAAIAAAGLLYLLTRKRSPNPLITIIGSTVDTQCRCFEEKTHADGTQTRTRVAMEVCLKSEDPDVESGALNCLAKSPQVPEFVPSTLGAKVEGGVDALEGIAGSVKAAFTGFFGGLDE